jgi:hypothetical protein
VSTMFGQWVNYGTVSHYVLADAPLCGATGRTRGEMIVTHGPTKDKGRYTPPLCKDCIRLNTNRWRRSRDSRTIARRDDGPDGEL